MGNDCGRGGDAAFRFRRGRTGTATAATRVTGEGVGDGEETVEGRIEVPAGGIEASEAEAEAGWD